MNWMRLAPRARWLFHLQAALRWLAFWTPVCAAAAVAAATFGWGAGALGLAAAVWVVTFLGAVWMPSLAFERFGYRWRGDALHIVSGVLVRSVVSIPATRIQHVDVRQGPLERSLQLARVEVHTASGGAADGVIGGLEFADAEQLRDELLRRIDRDDGV